MSDSSVLSAHALALPKLPLLTLGKFDADDFHDWMHTAQRFFVQYKIWDIVTGDSVMARRSGQKPSVRMLEALHRGFEARERGLEARERGLEARE